MSPDSSRLDGLQRRVLATLATFEPPWTLVGGAALAGFHLGHRTTRDLDLFWRERAELRELPRELVNRLHSAGFDARIVQSGSSFARIRVADGDAVTVVDLVADPGPAIEAPRSLPVGDRMILVSGAHDLFVDKLCALLGRSEVRDLVDVKALLDAGADLDRGLRDAPRRDAGFSPMTLTWTLRGLDVERLGTTSGMPGAELDALLRFRDGLVARVAERIAPPR